MEVIPMRTLTYPIRPEEDGCPVRDYLKNLGYPRSVLTRLKHTDGSVCNNGIPVPLYTILHTSDFLEVSLPAEPSSVHILPEALPLEILYEDEDILVVNKPAGMPVHPSMGHHTGTLANALAYYNERTQCTGTFHCINRLDRDTSGLTVIARHQLSAALLSAQMHDRMIHREYLAIASGFVEDQTICAPIARVRNSVIMRQVDPLGETAVTHFRLLGYQKGFSLISCLLETGRTHQIRVHLQFIGHPLIGDFLYNPTDHRMAHQALHGWKLDFLHPITHMPMHFEAPVPEDFILCPDTFRFKH